MKRMTKLNGCRDAILTDFSRTGVIDDAIYKLCKYETACEDIYVLKSEYEWLLYLNDDNLSEQVVQTNDVQNALIELLRFVDEIIKVNEV